MLGQDQIKCRKWSFQIGGYGDVKISSSRLKLPQILSIQEIKKVSILYRLPRDLCFIPRQIDREFWFWTPYPLSFLRSFVSRVVLGLDFESSNASLIWSTDIELRLARISFFIKNNFWSTIYRELKHLQSWLGKIIRKVIMHSSK